MADTGFALAAVREDGRWHCDALDAVTLTNLDAAITELRRVRTTGAVVGMLAVDDEFFVLIRPIPGGVTLLLSDSMAALDYDVAADVLDLLRIELPDADEQQVWPEGDLGILADLGLPEVELEIIVEQTELYPDEQLRMIAQRCGFVSQFDQLLQRIES